MNIDKTYDYIIYSAGLAGVLTALELSNKGKSVLLLNFYGFLGGSITESLNCLQLVDENKLNESSRNVFNKVRELKHGILYEREKEFILNPENVKIILQELIEASEVELLFHIVPFYMKQRADHVELSLTGKEGIFHVKGKTIVDASDEYDLLKLENAKRSLGGLYYNMFLTGLKNDKWQGFERIHNFIKLDDNRYWLSLKIPKPENEFFIENGSQKLLNEFEEVVHKSGGRIQLIAPQSQKIYEVDKLKISESIFHIKGKLIKTFKAHEKFKECLELIINI